MRVPSASGASRTSSSESTASAGKSSERQDWTMRTPGSSATWLPSM